MHFKIKLFFKLYFLIFLSILSLFLNSMYCRFCNQGPFYYGWHEEHEEKCSKNPANIDITSLTLKNRISCTYLNLKKSFINNRTLANHISKYHKTVSINTVNINLFGISPKISKNASEDIAPLLTRLFNDCISSSQFPEEFKLVIVTPLYKKKAVLQILTTGVVFRLCLPLVKYLKRF